jgi:hypothetical protein
VNTVMNLESYKRLEILERLTNWWLLKNGLVS